MFNQPDVSPLTLGAFLLVPIGGFILAYAVSPQLLPALDRILYSNGPLGVLRSDLSTTLMVTLPVNLIPSFFVPLFILLHLLSLKRSRELA